MNLKNVFLITGIMVFTAVAQAETVKCRPISRLPYTITLSGVYCLSKNLPFLVSGIPAFSGTAITITTDDVILDLNGHVLSNDGANNTTQTHAIDVSGHSNIVVKNGMVRGFQYGISLQGGGENNVVENIEADANLLIAITNDSAYGIVRNNRVTNTGNSSFLSEFAYGICATGDHVRILNNSVSGVNATGAGEAYGIGCTTGTPTHAIIRDNMISDISSLTGAKVGIYLHGGSDNIVANNQISDADVGINFDLAGTGIYMNNVVFTGGTKYTGGTAAGSTNY